MRRVSILLALAACGRGDPGDRLDAVSAERSTVTVAPAGRIPADGFRTFAVAVIVRNTQGEPLAGRPVHLAAEGETNISQPAPTDETGLALGTVASSTAGDQTLTVIVDPGPTQLVLAATPTLGFGLLLLAYGFDADGVSAEDSSPEGHTGAISGATWIDDGPHGGALEFDGVDDAIDIGYAEPYFGQHIDHPEITVEVWVRPRELNRVQTIYQLGGEDNCATLGLTDTGHAWFVLRNSGSVVELQSPAPLVADSWVHLAGTSSTETVLYVDGVEVAQRAGPYVWETGSSGHTVGRHGGSCSGLLGPPCGVSTGLFFAGTVDDLRVWEFGRSLVEVLADMERPAP